MSGILTWLRRLTDGQMVELARRVSRALTQSHDIDVPQLRAALEDFVRNLPKLVVFLALIFIGACQPHKAPMTDAEVDFWSHQFHAAFPNGYPPPVRVILAGGAATPGNEGMAGESLGPKLSPSVLAPSAVTDMRVVAATDTSLVLSWTEVPSSLTSVAKYVIRYDSLGGFTDWGAEREVTTGGCGAPVYGSTATGGRIRSCVLGGLQAHHAYDIQLRAFTGTMNLNAVYGPVSNLARGVTAERIGPMLVVRPPMFLDTVAIEAASLDYDFGPRLFPLHGKFPVGDRLASFYDSTGTLTAWGYLLLVKPQ